MVAVKKEEDTGQLELIRKVILAKLNSLKSRQFEDKSLDEFSLAFRVFLLKYLKLNYEFTEEELSAELDKRGISKLLKERILKITSLVEEIKYKEKKLTKDEFQTILGEGIHIIQVAIPSEEKEAGEKPAESRSSVAKPSLGFFVKIKSAINEWKKERERREAEKKKLERKEEIASLAEESKRQLESRKNHVKEIAVKEKEKAAEPSKIQLTIIKFWNEKSRQIKEYLNNRRKEIQERLKIRAESKKKMELERQKSHEESRKRREAFKKWQQLKLKQIMQSGAKINEFFSKFITKREKLTEKELHERKEALRKNLFEERKLELEQLHKIKKQRELDAKQRKEHRQKLLLKIETTFKNKIKKAREFVNKLTESKKKRAIDLQKSHEESRKRREAFKKWQQLKLKQIMQSGAKINEFFSKFIKKKMLITGKKAPLSCSPDSKVSKTKHTASQLHFSLVNIESEKRRLSSSINETDARIKSIEHHIIAQSRDNINPAQQKNLMAQKQKLLNDKKNYLKQLEAKETEMKRMDGALRKVIKGQNSIVAKISKRKPNFIDFIQPYLKSMGYWLYHKTKTKSSKNDN